MAHDITDMHTIELYNKFKDYYTEHHNQFVSIPDSTIKQDISLTITQKWNPNSLKMYIEALIKMTQGEQFTNTINKYSEKYFIEHICEDFKDICDKATESLNLHKEYYNSKEWKKDKSNITNDNENSILQNDNKKYDFKALNKILYGPPGTGKTYSTVAMALEILKASNEQKRDIKSIGQLKKEFGSQVEFVTFHQSFSYEDFVEGLKAKTNNEKIAYEIERGVFKDICDKAQKNLDNFQNIIKNEIEIKVLLNDFANYVQNENTRGNQLLLAKKIDGFWGDTYFGEILRNNDDTFKSFKTTGSVASQNLTEKIILRDYQNFYDGNIKVYKDIKPAQNSQASYHGNALYYYQLFKRIKEYQDYDDTTKDYFIDNSHNIKKPYIIIIDEINRGNISRIFGELITLIEESKRSGNNEEISLQLPYSKEPFSVPNNLYIIGTMNTADRSLTLMDTALRRRFDFIEMLPNITLVEGSFDGIDVKKILEFINERIEILYDREHTIGHAFLMDIDNLNKLKNAFKNKILPLLEEYFYDDIEKIKLVLNDDLNNFYKKKKHTLGDIYIKKDINNIQPEAFIKIYETSKDNEE